jgi:NAD(P)-dependent dehydrogenase (short-subunit alcohol dehydrogenase family)
MGILNGKVAIVTGAGRGIGREEAILLAKEGAKVVVNDAGVHYDGTGTSRGPAEDVANEIKKMGGEAVPNFDNVSDFKGAANIVKQAIETYGALHIVVNNAGILRDKMLFNMEEEMWDAVIAVHLKGTFNMCRHACAYWREQHKAGNILYGKIINTSSDAGLLGNPGQTNYGAAKAGIAALTIILAKEMARYNVSVNCIAPIARTRLTTDATPSLAALMSMKPPEGQFDPLDPANIAPLVAYLASDDANDITGQVFRVAGDVIWLLRGWHTVDKIKKGGARWEPAEIGPKLKEMLKKAPPPEEMTTPFADLGMSG